MGKPFVIGIDIGGQSTKLGVVDARGNIIIQTSFDTREIIALKVYMNEMEKSLARIINLPAVGGKDKIKGIGIGAPNGNYYTGTIESAPNLKWAKDKQGNPEVVYLKKTVEAALNLPVVVTNDANAAAQGEMIYGAAKGMKNFIEITLGTGVGSGIVIDGKVVYGHDGFAGELGHTTSIRRTGRQCNCGKIGCLETYASAIGVARTARELLEMEPRRASLLRNLPADDITSKDVAGAAAKGDELSIDVFNYTGRLLGEAFADFVAFSAPEAIILFGGLAQAGDLIFKPTLEAMEDNLLSIWKGKVKLLHSELPGSEAAILGSAALAWEL
ncbi:MAG: ROK family protein [Bacteroidales bacterium]|jgi:glucokinase|nr:ROK family protein [Bacteroidales bacterium]MDD2264094.1 ROK family protein [Bacteroidales bacterium]MDD2831435.1 ROK family protein [Bacteroidales bacterium]MDD3208429.1 ROK family protein [Bacteroidales bacterium]MDD3696888.1 ROK family protein [Bacteroidales bacterium]